ncbi:APC family permease [Streptomyces sp. NPDC056291]|uniref:APC family permease n=1 Tax=Streptomyces sp. NPDC056291 TaxID=3345772 RepID=UPI0035D7D72D
MHGVSLYVCAILGAGVLTLPGQVASLAGPASLVAWIFVICMSIPLAFTFAQLGTEFPDSGGVAVFAARAFGDVAGGIAGWWYFIAGSVGQTIVPLTAGYYLVDAFGLSQGLAPFFGLAILAASVCVTLSGLRFGGWVQMVLAAGVCIILVIAIVAALPEIQWSQMTPFAPAGTAAIGSAGVVLFYAFSGWEAVVHMAGDFRDVGRNLPRATAITLVTVAVLYLGAALAVVGTHSYGTAEMDRVSLAVVVSRKLGVSTGLAVGLAAAVICLATTTAFLSSIASLGTALGRDGWAPKALTRRNRRGAPSTAVATVAGIGVLGLLLCVVAQWGTADLVAVPATLVLTTYLVASAAGMRLLRGKQRLLPGLSFAMAAVVAPSAGAHLLIAAGIALAVALAGLWRRQVPG